jgi:hypothetical protein
MPRWVATIYFRSEHASSVRKLWFILWHNGLVVTTSRRAWLNKAVPAGSKTWTDSEDKTNDLLTGWVWSIKERNDVKDNPKILGALDTIEKKIFCQICFQETATCRVPVAHTCNPSYSGGRDQEDRGLKPPWANSSWNPISKNPSQK